VLKLKAAMLKELHVRTVFFVLWAFALTMALLPQPPSLPIDQYGDKFAHVLAFAVLALFARVGFARMSDRLILERLSFTGALIEMFQAVPALNRDCDWRDWVADTLAVAVVLLIMRALPWRRLVTGRARRTAR
jgi:hypothetical protein